METKSSILQTPLVLSSLQNIFRSSKGSKDMYTILNDNSSVPTAQRKWNTVFDINSNEWKQIYILPFKVTACTKLHWFQFRINHNILATNYFLKKLLMMQIVIFAKRKMKPLNTFFGVVKMYKIC